MGDDEASGEELMTRPFPEMNDAPATEPLDPPEPQPSGAPRVERLDQILTVDALRKLRLWIRRCRRCLRFAALGNVRMAKKMRPPDVWLPAETSMRPETLPWNWDLRPLMTGGEAVPHPTSGRDGVDPLTGLRLDNLRQVALEATMPDGFADQAIVSEMIFGIDDDVTSARGSLLCAPHGSALAEWDVACERISRNVAKGWATEAELPCWPIMACPYGVVDESARAGEPKWRLTNDLSWPQPGMLPDGAGGYVRSHNGAMDRSGWPQAKMMHVTQLSESAAIMQQAGAPVKLWSADCNSFYRIMGRQRAQIWRNALAIEAGFQVDERCCFGSAADATKCSRVTNVIVFYARKAMDAIDETYPTQDPRILAWQAERREHAEAQGFVGSRADRLGVLGGYIDDLSGCSFADPVVDTHGVALLRDGIPVTRATLHFEALIETLEWFGHSSNVKKEQSPRDYLEVLGTSVDLSSRRVKLLPGKRRRYAEKLEEMLQQQSAPRVEYLRVLGRLQSAVQCYPRGRLWLNAAWRSVRAEYRLGGDRVPITRKAREDLRHWVTELKLPDPAGVPLATRAPIRPCGAEGTGAIYADASGEIGWSAWTVAGGELLLVLGEWDEREREQLLICEKELYASTAGLTVLAEAAGFREVWSFTDNTVALAAMRSMAPKTTRMQLLTEARTSWMFENGVREAAERISTKNNLWADLGSRGRVDVVLQQAERLGLRWRVLEVPEPWGAAWPICGGDMLGL